LNLAPALFLQAAAAAAAVAVAVVAVGIRKITKARRYLLTARISIVFDRWRTLGILFLRVQRSCARYQRWWALTFISGAYVCAMVGIISDFGFDTGFRAFSHMCFTCAEIVMESQRERQ